VWRRHHGHEKTSFPSRALPNHSPKTRTGCREAARRRALRARFSAECRAQLPQMRLTAVPPRYEGEALMRLARPEQVGSPLITQSVVRELPLNVASSEWRSGNMCKRCEVEFRKIPRIIHIPPVARRRHTVCKPSGRRRINIVRREFRSALVLVRGRPVCLCEPEEVWHEEVVAWKAPVGTRSEWRAHPPRVHAGRSAIHISPPATFQNLLRSR